jgi:hypothetical protein
LRESILMFLMPHVPGGEDVRQIGGGDAITFTIWKIEGEDMIPVFTSSARVQEALQAAGKWDEKNGVGEMQGLELLQHRANFHYAFSVFEFASIRGIRVKIPFNFPSFRPENF